MLEERIMMFNEFLNNVWSIIEKIIKLSKNSNFILDDFLQANWEILVEQFIVNPGEFIECYGDGADINGSSSRILFPDELPTHRITVNTKGEIKDVYNDEIVNNKNLIFEYFVNFNSGYIEIKAPFNYILVQDFENSMQRVFSIDSVSFSLEQIN